MSIKLERYCGKTIVQLWRIAILIMILAAGPMGQEKKTDEGEQTSAPADTVGKMPSPKGKAAKKLPDLVRSDRLIRPVQMGGQSFDVESPLVSEAVLLNPAEGQAPPPPKKKRDFLVVPIPNSNPTTGFGLTAVAGLIYPLPGDTPTTPPSSTLLGGVCTENGTWGLGFMQEAYLAQDRYRLKLGGGYVGVNWDLDAAYGSADQYQLNIPFNQKGYAFMGECLVRLSSRFFIGPTFSYASLDTAVRSDFEFPDGPGIEEIRADIQDALSARLSQIGVHALWDSRDNTFFPRRGWLADFEANMYREAWGSEFNYEVYLASVNRYIGLGPNQVLALRGHGRFAGGDMPFFAQSALGVGPDLRGYSFGEHLDK